MPITIYKVAKQWGYLLKVGGESVWGDNEVRFYDNQEGANEYLNAYKDKFHYPYRLVCESIEVKDVMWSATVEEFFAPYDITHNHCGTVAFKTRESARRYIIDKFLQQATCRKYWTEEDITIYEAPLLGDMYAYCKPGGNGDSSHYADKLVGKITLIPIFDE